MEKIWAIALLLFLTITFLVWKFVNGFYKKEYSKKARKTWGARTYYWHFILMISGAVTSLIIFLLKWGNVLSF
jgi:hypothetical protein